MKRINKFILLSMSVLLVAFLAACGDDSSDGDGGTQDYPSTVTIGTASQGGTYYVWGGGLASLLDELDITANVEVTGGPVHNIQLLENGDIQLGMATVGPLYEGFQGEAEWTNGNTYEDIRVIFPMYVTPFQWYSLASTGVTSITEHEGERVGVGPAGGTPGTYNPQIYEVLGIETGEQVQAGANDMTSQMLDGQLNHIGFSAGVPVGSIVEAENQTDINIYGIDGELREKVIEALPFFSEFTIPDGTYDSQDGPIETVGQYNFGIVNKNANEDFVYDLVKTYHEQSQIMINTHASAEEGVDPQAILNNDQFYMHPGAIRYYEELGIDLPEGVYPPEWSE